MIRADEPREAKTRGALVRVNLVQVAYGDHEPPAARLKRVVDLALDAPAADLIVLPELWTAGGFDYAHWKERSEPLDAQFVRTMSDLARRTGSTVHGGSFIESSGDSYFNTSVVFGADGGLRATYRKMHRFGSGEKTMLDAGARIKTVPLELGSATRRVGLATCYDLRFPELFRALVDAGSEFFIVPAAWPAARISHWEALGRARAIENQAFVLQCNTAGTHAGVQMGGRSQVIGPGGELLAAAGEGEEVLSVDLQPDAVRDLRSGFDVLADRRIGIGHATV